MVGAFLCLLLPSSFTGRGDHFFSYLVNPFSKGSRKLSLAVTDKLRQSGEEVVSPRTYQRLKQEYLRERNLRINMSEELVYHKRLAERLTGLRQKFGLERAGVKFILGYVTGNDTSNQREVKLLDVGSIDKVSPGQIVLGWV